jgi:hypothetical protein
MLMANPTVLRTLVERYETLHGLTEGSEDVDPHVRQQLQDTVYTLCVSTGTREIGPALTAARAHMARADFVLGDVGGAEDALKKNAA